MLDSLFEPLNTKSDGEHDHENHSSSSNKKYSTADEDSDEEQDRDTTFKKSYSDKDSSSSSKEYDDDSEGDGSKGNKSLRGDKSSSNSSGSGEKGSSETKNGQSYAKADTGRKSDDYEADDQDEDEEKGDYEKDKTSSATNPSSGSDYAQPQSFKKDNALPAADCQALKKVYNEMNGTSWYTQLGWSNPDDPDCCHYGGVTCDSQSRVVDLDLGENNLAGPLSSGFFQLDQLKRL